MKRLLIGMASLLLFSCANRHMRTDRICDRNLYVEFYTDPSDMGAIYLTDSVNFKVKVTRFNIESEYFKYDCNLDSLTIELYSNYPIPKHILVTKTFKLTKLIEEGKFDN